MIFSRIWHSNFHGNVIMQHQKDFKICIRIVYWLYALKRKLKLCETRSNTYRNQSKFECFSKFSAVNMQISQPFWTALLIPKIIGYIHFFPIKKLLYPKKKKTTKLPIKTKTKKSTFRIKQCIIIPLQHLSWAEAIMLYTP